jgi:hypothetical protein
MGAVGPLLSRDAAPGTGVELSELDMVQYAISHKAFHVAMLLLLCGCDANNQHKCCLTLFHPNDEMMMAPKAPLTRKFSAEVSTPHIILVYVTPSKSLKSAHVPFPLGSTCCGSLAFEMSPNRRRIGTRGDWEARVVAGIVLVVLALLCFQRRRLVKCLLERGVCHSALEGHQRTASNSNKVSCPLFLCA